MRALVVLSQPPLPEGGAPGRCAIALIRGLRSHGVDVLALAARRHHAQAGDPPVDLSVETIAIPPEPPSWRARWDRVRRPGGELARGEFAARVRDAAAKADVIHLEETETAWCDQGVPLPALVHLQFLMGLDRPRPSPLTREFRYHLEIDLAERAAVRRHHHLVASSPLVARALRRLAPRADVELAPLSLDPQYYRPAPLDGPPVAGIIGTAMWPPTEAAVRRLLTRVWPAVRRHVPSARLLIAGRGMAEAIRGLGSDTGVDVVGEVESAAEFLRGLSLLLYPLSRGSGMKVKVLEALAVGLPIVTTDAGAEGVERGGGVVVASDDGDLARSAAAILRDPGERSQRGAAARRTFELRYTPGPATAPLVELYRRMI